LSSCTWFVLDLGGFALVVLRWRSSLRLVFLF